MLPLTLEDILKLEPSYREFSLIEEIAGTANRCYRLANNHGHFALRSMTNLRIGAASRACEFNIWQSAAERDIAPKLSYIDPLFRFCLSQWIEAHALFNTDDCIRTLKIFHGIVERDAGRFNVLDAIDTYCKQLNLNLNAVHEHCRTDFEQLVNDKHRWRLCHNDLSANNILTLENKVLFLDFEYAAINHCFMDLSSLYHHKNNSLSIDELLSLYLNRSPSKVDRELFTSADRLSLWLGFLWSKYECPSWTANYRGALKAYYQDNPPILRILSD